MAGIKITFFDVGKGDAILIETAEHKMMIDAGYEDTAGMLLDFLKSRESRNWIIWCLPILTRTM